jgi:hypothetical protein
MVLKRKSNRIVSDSDDEGVNGSGEAPPTTTKPSAGTKQKLPYTRNPAAANAEKNINIIQDLKARNPLGVRVSWLGVKDSEGKLNTRQGVAAYAGIHNAKAFSIEVKRLWDMEGSFLKTFIADYKQDFGCRPRQPGTFKPLAQLNLSANSGVTQVIFKDFQYLSKKGSVNPDTIDAGLPLCEERYPPHHSSVNRRAITYYVVTMVYLARNLKGLPGPESDRWYPESECWKGRLIDDRSPEFWYSMLVVLRFIITHWGADPNSARFKATQEAGDDETNRKHQFKNLKDEEVTYLDDKQYAMQFTETQIELSTVTPWFQQRIGFIPNNGYGFFSSTLIDRAFRVFSERIRPGKFSDTIMSAIPPQLSPDQLHQALRDLAGLLPALENTTPPTAYNFDRWDVHPDTSELVSLSTYPKTTLNWDDERTADADFLATVDLNSLVAVVQPIEAATTFCEASPTGRLYEIRGWPRVEQFAATDLQDMAWLLENLAGPGLAILAPSRATHCEAVEVVMGALVTFSRFLNRFVSTDVEPPSFTSGEIQSIPRTFGTDIGERPLLYRTDTEPQTRPSPWVNHPVLIITTQSRRTTWIEAVSSARKVTDQFYGFQSRFATDIDLSEKASWPSSEGDHPYAHIVMVTTMRDLVSDLMPEDATLDCYTLSLVIVDDTSGWAEQEKSVRVKIAELKPMGFWFIDTDFVFTDTRNTHLFEEVLRYRPHDTTMTDAVQEKDTPVVNLNIEGLRSQHKTFSPDKLIEFAMNFKQPLKESGELHNPNHQYLCVLLLFLRRYHAAPDVPLATIRTLSYPASVSFMDTFGYQGKCRGVHEYFPVEALEIEEKDGRKHVPFQDGRLHELQALALDPRLLHLDLSNLQGPVNVENTQVTISPATNDHHLLDAFFLRARNDVADVPPFDIKTRLDWVTVMSQKMRGLIDILTPDLTPGKSGTDEPTTGEVQDPIAEVGEQSLPEVVDAKVDDSAQPAKGPQKLIVVVNCPYSIVSLRCTLATAGVPYVMVGLDDDLTTREKTFASFARVEKRESDTKELDESDAPDSIRILVLQWSDTLAGADWVYLSCNTIVFLDVPLYMSTTLKFVRLLQRPGQSKNVVVYVLAQLWAENKNIQYAFTHFRNLFYQKALAECPLRPSEIVTNQGLTLQSLTPYGQESTGVRTFRNPVEFYKRIMGQSPDFGIVAINPLPTLPGPPQKAAENQELINKSSKPGEYTAVLQV